MIQDFKGLVQVYTGSGKGKTTAAFGLALRALGRGIPVFIVQFMKNKDSGEFIMAEKMDNVTIYTFGTDRFVDKSHPSAEDLSQAKKALKKSEELIRQNAYGVLILDEINNALDFGLLKTEDVLALISIKQEAMELVLTGRNVPGKIAEKADLVTEMLEIKHPWQRNIAARKGIEW